MTVTEARARAQKLLDAADAAEKAGQTNIDSTLIADLQAQDDQARAQLQAVIDGQS